LKINMREDAKMLRGTGLVFFLFTLTQGASAQPAALTAQQQQGQMLFSQSCGVCHLKPQITAATFGPVLSKESGGGRDDMLREVIMNGTPRMPGFKLNFEPAQVDAIVAYLKTVPAPQPAPR
jgi:mono/diheme cytochrome c family protein